MMENKIIINEKEYYLRIDKTENGDFYIGYWDDKDNIAETETCYLILGPDTLDKSLDDLQKKLEENRIMSKANNKQYLWNYLSGEEKQNLEEECIKIGKIAKEKYPSKSLEAFRYWKSLSSKYTKDLSHFMKYYGK